MNAGRLRVPSPLSRVKSYTIAAFGYQGPSCLTHRYHSSENKFIQKQREPRAGEKKKKVKSDQMILKGGVTPWNAQVCESKKKKNPLFVFYSNLTWVAGAVTECRNTAINTRSTTGFPEPVFLTCERGPKTTTCIS